jgi:toxin HigB-1
VHELLGGDCVQITAFDPRNDRRLHERVFVRLDALDKALRLEDLNVPGFHFHRLQGFNPPRYTLHVNGAWCVTFEWKDGDALRVDYEQYH